MTDTHPSCGHCGHAIPPGARFCTQCGAPAPIEPTQEERRHVTVMFCDLVTDPPLAEQLDPEALVQVVQRYHRLGAQIIHRYEGHIAQYLGDGLLVFFGYPQAYEDNALRAIHASWQILRSLASLNTDLRQEFGVSLEVRVGIHSGQIVVARIGDAQQHRQAFGRSMNLSARLQGLAAPNRIVISRDTLRLLGGSVRVRDLGLHELKGIEGPIAAYEVIRPLRSHEWSRAPDAGEDTAIVGRDRELAELLDCWERARRGAGCVVSLVGEAGIGKTRLVRGLRARLADEPHVFAQASGSAYHRFSTFHPAIELLAQTLGIDLADEAAIDPSSIADNLRGTALEAAAPRFARLLELPTETTGPATSSDVERESTLDALTEWLATFGGELPTLLVVEDLHYVDPSTLELVHRLAQRADQTKLLLITTARPSDRRLLPRIPDLRSIALYPLSRSDAQKLLVTRAAGRALPDALVHTLVDRTDGLPLFVEELTKMVLESDALTDGDASLLGGLVELERSIPTTLQDSLMARLDRLADAKQVAQTASILGREFPRRVLEALLDEDSTRIHRALDRLVKAEILEQHGDASHASFAFRHALIQEAAYHSLLRSTRQALHRRAAEVLRRDSPSLMDAAPEILAHHYDQGGETERAIEAWQRAGQRAIAASATLEAQGHLERALALIRELPPSPERDRRELLPQAGLVVALYTRRGYAASDVRRAVEHALELSSSVGWSPITAFLSQLHITFLTTRGEYAQARQLVGQLIDQASSRGDRAVVLRAKAVLGQTLLFEGEFRAAEKELGEAIRLRELEPAGRTALTHGVDTSLMSTGWLSWIHHFRGNYAQSVEHRRASLEQAEAIAHPYSIAFASLQAGTLALLRSETEDARTRVERAYELSRKYRFGFCEAWAIVLRGWIRMMERDLAGGELEVARGLERWDACEATIGRSIWLSLRGAAWALQGDPARGLEAIEAARGAAEKSGERIYLAELDRLAASAHGATAALRSPTTESSEDDVEHVLRRGLERAERQGARWFQLRCATDLAAALTRRGAVAEARTILERALDGVEEVHAPSDLGRARRQLARIPT